MDLKLNSRIIEMDRRTKRFRASCEYAAFFVQRKPNDVGLILDERPATNTQLRRVSEVLLLLTHYSRERPLEN